MSANGKVPDTDELAPSEGPPKVLADYGGRRKVFERRLTRAPIAHPDRRDGQDRRSGFDRRSTITIPPGNISDANRRQHPPHKDS